MRKFVAVLAPLAAVGFAVPAHAQNYSELTSSVDWSTAITALMAVGGAVALILVARKGIRFVLGMIR